MIVLDNVCKTYSTGVAALNGVNLRIHKGEFVFIVGSSGSGKTTLFKLLLKELEPTSGKIFLNSKNISRLRRGKVPKMRRGLGVVFQDFRLLKDRNVYENVALARALVNNPPVLLADEPTGNLDPTNAWDIMMLLDDINKRGTTVVVVTHNQEIVERMQKRVITIDKGVVVSDEKGGIANDW